MTFFNIKRSTLEHEDDTPPDLPQLDCQLNDITLSVSEVSNIIQNLDKSKATGPDQVHNRLLTVASSILLNLLLYYSTDLSVKPSSLLFGKFLTLPPCTKRSPRSFVTTIVSCTGKVLEQCIHKHVYNLLQYNNIIYSITVRIYSWRFHSKPITMHLQWFTFIF